MKPRFINEIIRDSSLARVVVAALCLIALGATANPIALIEQVSLGRQEGDANAQLDAFRLAVEYAPYDAKLQLELAETEARTGNIQSAVNSYRRVAETESLTWQQWQRLGTLQASLGMNDAAIASWEAATSEADAADIVDSQMLFSPLINAYIEREDWASVQSILVALNEYDPLRADYRYQLGLTQALNASPEASTTLAETIALDPAYARPLASLQAFIDQRDTYDADSGYHQLGIIFLELGELEYAQAAFDRAVLINPAYSQAMVYRSLIDIEFGEIGLDGVQQAVALAPDNPEVLIVAGLAWRNAGDPFGARALFEQAYQIDPSNPAVASEIAATFRAENNLVAAEAWTREATRLAPNDPRFQVLLAQFYLDENYLVATVGLPLARDIAAAYPENAEAQATLGQALFLVDDYNGALEQLSLAIMLDFRLARAQYYLGQTLQARGDLAEARRQYETVLTNSPDSLFAAASERALATLSNGG